VRVVLEFEDEKLAKIIINQLTQMKYDVDLNRTGDVFGVPTKEYIVRQPNIYPPGQ
jgi:hypothetical protein